MEEGRLCVFLLRASLSSARQRPCPPPAVVPAGRISQAGSAGIACVPSAEPKFTSTNSLAMWEELSWFAGPGPRLSRVTHGAQMPRTLLAWASREGAVSVEPGRSLPQTGGNRVRLAARFLQPAEPGSVFQTNHRPHASFLACWCAHALGPYGAPSSLLLAGSTRRPTIRTQPEAAVPSKASRAEAL